MKPICNKPRHVVVSIYCWCTKIEFYIYLDIVPSPLDVYVLKAFFACVRTEIEFFSSVNIEEAFEQLRTADTVEKRSNSTWASNCRRFWMLSLFVDSRLYDFWVVLRWWGWEEFIVEKTNLFIRLIFFFFQECIFVRKLTTPYIAERHEWYCWSPGGGLLTVVWHKKSSRPQL